MEAGALLIAIGAFLLASVGYLVFQVVADEAKEAVFRPRILRRSPESPPCAHEDRICVRGVGVLGRFILARGGDERT
jgi:hypothetical protein